MSLSGKYIKDVVLGASDGIVTTFAVVSGVVGAGLSVEIIIILGFANLLSDSFSMAAGTFLGSRSEESVLEYEKVAHEHSKSPTAAAVMTLFAFIIAGSLPLLPFIFFKTSIGLSILATALALFVVGALRSHFTKRSWFLAGLEMLLVGGIAAIVAYTAGYFISQLV